MKEMIRRLSRLNDLKREVNELSQRIAQLEREACGSARFSGMPRNPMSADRASQIAARAMDVRDQMEARRLDCMEELGRIYAFIDDVDDSRMRQILSARYIDGLSWQGVATRIGESDEQTPRRLHNRFLQKKIEENAKFDENDES